MSDPETYESHRLGRRHSNGSTNSGSENDDNTPEESQSVLAPPAENVGGANDQHTLRLFKRALQPVMDENKRTRVELASMGRQLTTVLQQNEHLQTQVKDLRAVMTKGTEDLSVLLTGEGIAQLKLMCFRNLDFKAKDAEETELMDRFFNSAKENGWLVKSSAKAMKDITINFREKRNYLKSQIKIRIYSDLSNKTANYSAKLPETTRFVIQHLGVTELSDYCKLVLFNLAYTILKYCNAKLDTSTMTEGEKAILKEARDTLWLYVMGRVDKDRKAKRTPESAMEKIRQLIDNGVTFEPLKVG